MNRRSAKDHWLAKFGHALRGVRVGVRGQSSFTAHFVMAALVTLCALLLNVSLLEWCVLVLCIGIVMSAELFNSALEHLAKAVTNQFDDDVRNALDIASAAVLFAAVAAAIVGVTIFVFRFGFWIGWWGGYSVI